MSRRATAVVGVGLLLLVLLVVNRLDTRPRADRRVEITEQTVRRPTRASPTCVLRDRVRRACVLVEQSVTRPVLVGDVVVALTGGTASGLDAETLEVRWTAPSSSTPSPIAARGDRVLLRNGTRLLLRDTTTGDAVWSMPRPDTVWTSPDVDVVVSVTDGVLAVRDTEDGSVVWQDAAPLPSDVAVVGDRVAVTDGDPTTDDQWRDVATGEVDEVAPIDPVDLPLPGRRSPSSGPHASWSHRGADADVRVTVGDGRDVTAFTLESRTAGDPTDLVTDGRVVAVAFADSLEFHDVRTGAWISSFPALAPSVVSLAPLVVHGNGLLYRLDDEVLVP